MHEHSLHLVLLKLDFPSLFLHFLFALTPLLVHSFSPLFRCLPGLAGPRGGLFLLSDPVRLKGVIFLELLVVQGLLPEFFPLLRLMILMQSREGAVYFMPRGG